MADLVAEHHQTVTERHVTYRKTQRARRDRIVDRARGLSRNRSRERDQGYDLSL